MMESLKMRYKPAYTRYEKMKYNRCGRSGLMLPAVALGLWHNFGGVDKFEISRVMVCRAFDLGITHFDLANNYGLPAGSAEYNFGKILKLDLAKHRDEMIISTKAGYLMWPGPYGEWGSRKHLLASIDQSLKRLGLDYVDIFYSHRFDLNTPLDETMSALDTAVKQGKALYTGISNYGPDQTIEAAKILRQLGSSCRVHQPNYSMLDRWVEKDLLDILEKEGIGCICFSPLAQGLLTDKYLKGIPRNSRAAKPYGFLKREQVTEQVLKKIGALNTIAHKRGQTLAQMAIAWVLQDKRITTVLIGASRVEQVEQNISALNNLQFIAEELEQIEKILNND